MSTANTPSGPPKNHEDLASEILVASWTLVSVSAIFLFTRCFAKLWTNRGLWVDDYILILAWICVLAPAVLSTVAVGDGFGMHVYNIEPDKVLPLAMLINSIVTVLILASALSKTSFVLTVLRFVQGWMRWAAWFILVSTNILFGLNIILAWLIFNPNPVPSSATPPPPPSSSTLTPVAIYGIAVTAYSAVMDIALVGMAWIVVSKLHMRSRREKVGVGIAMSMGMIAGATSIVKATIFPTLSDGDITFTSASLHIWSMVEPSITIIAASIPMLRIIFTRVRAMATQNSTRVGMGHPDYGPGPDRRRKGSQSVSVVTVSNSDGPKRTPYVDTFQSSEEILMLENLQATTAMQGENRPPREVEEGGDDAEPARSNFLYI